MTYPNSTLEIEHLREILDYSPETGIFVWKVKKSWRTSVGVAAGTPHLSGYICLGICGKKYRGHRLAWFYIHGVWPKTDIDHINGNRSDNRIENLREATQSENRQNLLSAHKNSSSGYLGVSLKRGKWAARIQVEGKAAHLGTFSTPELAHAAYVEAKRRLHPFNTL